MKIIFIEPPSSIESEKFRAVYRAYGSFGTSKTDFIWPPLELMGLAGYLTKNGIDSIIYDAGGMDKTFQDVRELVAKEHPDIVVFSTMTTTIYSDLRVASIAKEISKEIVTVAVGAHVMVLPEETLNENVDLDIAVASEDGEIVIYNLVKSGGDPANVLGICYRDKNGNIRRNPPQPVCENLDELGFPAHDKIPMDVYHDPMTKRLPMTLVMAQRGCINRCIMCSCPLYTYRRRSVAHVIEELKWVKELGYKEVKFNDAGVTHNLEWANQLMDAMIANKLYLTWSGTARADRVNPDILKKMKAAGCHTLGVGMESANLTILKNIGKNVTPDQVREAVSMVKDAGMEVLVFFILGLPGETKETIEETIEFAKSLDTDLITLGHAQPHPGTRFYDYIKNNGFLATEDWSKYDPMKPPVYSYPELSSKEIHKAALSGIRCFYLRPSYLFKRLLSLRTLHDVKINAKNGMAFFKRFVFGK